MRKKKKLPLPFAFPLFVVCDHFLSFISCMDNFGHLLLRRKLRGSFSFSYVVLLFFTFKDSYQNCYKNMPTNMSYFFLFPVTNANADAFKVAVQDYNL